MHKKTPRRVWFVRGEGWGRGRWACGSQVTRSLMAVIDGRLWALSVAALVRDWDALQPVFDDVVESFTVADARSV